MIQMANIPGFVTVNEAAGQIGCTPVRVRQLIEEGELSGEKINPRMWLIREKSLERFLKKPREEKRGRPRISER